jgi:hypothetical protein
MPLNIGAGALKCMWNGVFKLYGNKGNMMSNYVVEVNMDITIY